MDNIKVMYYSKSGSCKRVATKIAKELSCDVDEIKSNRKIGFLKGAYMAIRKKLADITYIDNLNEFDKVVLITPVWADTIPPTTRAFLQHEQSNIKELYIVARSASSDPEKTIIKIKEICNPKNSFGITEKHSSEDDEINKIVNSLK